MRFTRAVAPDGGRPAAGCGGPGLAQTFIFGGQGEPVQFDPAVITDGISSRLTRQIFDTLVRVKPGRHHCVQPALAEKCEVSARRQDLDVPAPQEREVPRRRAVRRHRRRLELRALVKDEAPAARQPVKAGQTFEYLEGQFDGFDDKSVVRPSRRRARTPCSSRSGSPRRRSSRISRCSCSASPAPRPWRTGAPSSASTRWAPAPSSSSSGSRTRRSSSRRTPTTGGRSPTSSGPSSATSRTTPSAWPRSRPVRCTGSRDSTPTT